MPRLSANVSFLFTELEFLDRFAAAAEAGFRGVEFAFAYDHPAGELAARVRAAGLATVLINAPPGDRGLAALPGREADFAASLVVALRYAEALSCPRVHVMAGIVADADADRRAACRATYVRNLRAAARQAAAQGLGLTIEPINPRDMPGYFLTTQAEAHAVRREVGADNLKVQMDLYHAQVVEGDLSEKLRHWLPHIGHVQIAGVPGRHEPDVGELDCHWLLALLDELGYDGWVGCEYRPQRDTLSGLRWMDRWR